MIVDVFDFNFLIRFLVLFVRKTHFACVGQAMGRSRSRKGSERSSRTQRYLIYIHRHDVNLDDRSLNVVNLCSSF